MKIESVTPREGRHARSGRTRSCGGQMRAFPVSPTIRASCDLDRDRMRQGQWVGARVAWMFDSHAYAGTCDGWRRTSSLGVMWHVTYDDGDEEDFSRTDMHYGMLLYCKLQKQQQQMPCVRSDGILSQRSGRRPADPCQSYVSWPVIISPTRLSGAPPGADVRADFHSWIQSDARCRKILGISLTKPHKT